jgi:hypothetical protein
MPLIKPTRRRVRLTFGALKAGFALGCSPLHRGAAAVRLLKGLAAAARGQRGWLAARRGAPLSIQAQTGLALAAEISLQLCKME